LNLHRHEDLNCRIRELFDQLEYYHILKADCASWSELVCYSISLYVSLITS